MSAGGLICVYGLTVLGGAGCAGGLANGHLLAPTIYEAAAQAGLTSAVYFSQYWKGAARAAPPTMTEMVGFLAGSPIDWSAFDSEMAARAITELKSRGLPSLVTLYFAGADGIGHKDGIAGQIPYLSGTIDPLLGHILDAIESLDPSWREHTLFVLVSDHGRTDLVPYSEDPFLKADLQAALPAGATVAENGGMAYIYLDQPGLVDLPKLAAALVQDARLSSAVAAVRVRGPEDSPRDGRPDPDAPARPLLRQHGRRFRPRQRLQRRFERAVVGCHARWRRRPCGRPGEHHAGGAHHRRVSWFPHGFRRRGAAGAPGGAWYNSDPEIHGVREDFRLEV